MNAFLLEHCGIGRVIFVVGIPAFNNGVTGAEKLR
jgi:hypothetical protein